MTLSKDRIRGLFLGAAIGDALGLPCEGWSAEKIKEKYGKLTQYYNPQGHKYHDGLRAGSWTDDTQLTIAVAHALIEAGAIDLDTLAKHHVKAYKESTNGWGRTTREAIERLAQGVSWRDSGLFEPISAQEVGRPAVKGFGNGVSMKVGPLGAYLASRTFDWEIVTDQIASFSAMTHRTSMAVSSGLAHVFAVFRCLMSGEQFDKRTFLATVVNAGELGKGYFADTLRDDITARFKKLDEVNKDWTNERIIEAFGKGTYYVYNSLPFTYAFFLRDPTNIESLYECASAGGDTDSNASMLGTLLGALHGASFFPKHLVDSLVGKQELIALADAFSEKFGV